ncbi:hypothetical protein [Streptococcus sciuri]|uniref:Uncharacterized protein n=1 Tax=Streptococcus sciuri TaxID=2973939 RepID=A0ABT2FAA5_9STRE|nr:hypothetical protein [Streptococcus sciuri]MCS4488772.1 hypothetical protein [Streptococcus sciuri]
MTDDLSQGLYRKRQIGAEENSESTNREIVAFWNWERKNYFIK